MTGDVLIHFRQILPFHEFICHIKICKVQVDKSFGKRGEQHTRCHGGGIATRPFNIRKDLALNILFTSLLHSLNLPRREEPVHRRWENPTGRWRAADRASRGRERWSRREPVGFGTVECRIQVQLFLLGHYGGLHMRFLRGDGRRRHLHRRVAVHMLHLVVGGHVHPGGSVAWHLLMLMLIRRHLNVAVHSLHIRRMLAGEMSMVTLLRVRIRGVVVKRWLHGVWCFNCAFERRKKPRGFWKAEGKKKLSNYQRCVSLPSRSAAFPQPMLFFLDHEPIQVELSTEKIGTKSRSVDNGISGQPAGDLFGLVY